MSPGHPHPHQEDLLVAPVRFPYESESQLPNEIPQNSRFNLIWLKIYHFGGVSFAQVEIFGIKSHLPSHSQRSRSVPPTRTLYCRRSWYMDSTSRCVSGHLDRQKSVTKTAEANCWFSRSRSCWFSDQELGTASIHFQRLAPFWYRRATEPRLTQRDLFPRFFQF